EDGIRDDLVTGVQTCALTISARHRRRALLEGNCSRVLNPATARIAESIRQMSSLSARAGGLEVRLRFAGALRGEGIRALVARVRSEERRVGRGSECEWGATAR